MSTGDGFGFFAKYYEANKIDDDTTVEHVARIGKKKYLYKPYFSPHKTLQAITSTQEGAG